MFSPLSLKSKVKNQFFILFENKRKNKIKIYLKKQKTFSLIVIMFFSIKTKIKVFVLWEKNGSYICSFIHNLTQKNWSVKQSIRILRFLKGNSKILFFIEKKEIFYIWYLLKNKNKNKIFIFISHLPIRFESIVELNRGDCKPPYVELAEKTTSIMSCLAQYWVQSRIYLSVVSCFPTVLLNFIFLFLLVGWMYLKFPMMWSIVSSLLT